MKDKKKPLVMPKRLPTDGSIVVGQIPPSAVIPKPPNDEFFYIEVGGQRIEMSAYNAWRAFGLLSMMLKIPLPSATAKVIKLSNILQMTVGPERPLESLGERLAYYLEMKELAKATGGVLMLKCKSCRGTGFVSNDSCSIDDTMTPCLKCDSKGVTLAGIVST